jgi:hypothetical protein
MSIQLEPLEPHRIARVRYDHRPVGSLTCDVPPA